MQRGPKFAIFDYVAISEYPALSFKELVLSDKWEDGVEMRPPSGPAHFFLTPYDLLRPFYLAESPSLRKISGREICCLEDRSNLEYSNRIFMFPARFSNIVELDLRHCYIESTVLKAICSLPKSLEILRLSTSPNRGVWNEEWSHIRLSLIGEALQYHSKTLRVSELDLDQYVGSPLEGLRERYLGERDLHCIGSFKDFEALQALAIGFLTFLVDVDTDDCFEDIYPDD